MKKMDIIKFLIKESKLWRSGIERVAARRASWNDFEQKAKAQFNSIITEAKTQKLYENLYAHSSSDYPDKDKLPNFITFYWGQHPTGEFEFSEERKGRMVLERGCALHLSQLPSGEVVATLYPFHSVHSIPPKKYYTYKVYSSPDKISNDDLLWLVRIMFSLARSSTFARKLTFFDYFILFWLKARTILRDAWHKDWTDSIMNVLGKALDSKIDEVVKSDETSSNKAN